jgi:NADP-dependent 3-hydroxy acid dehydrogenase YdfG
MGALESQIVLITGARGGLGTAEITGAAIPVYGAGI